MNIVLIAKESAGIEAFLTLLNTDHRIVAVMASPQKSGFPGANVLAAAQKHGLPVWPAKLVKEAGLSEQLPTERVDTILNVHLRGGSGIHAKKARERELWCLA